MLRQSNKVLHIGANRVQERAFYDRLNLSVVWIEAIPELALRCEVLLDPYINQSVVQALISDENNTEVEFYHADNLGASSSLLPPQKHLQAYDTIRFDKKLRLNSQTLDTFMRNNSDIVSGLDALVMDVQGAELKCLQGGLESLENIRYVCCECFDYEAYTGCCSKDELDSFLTELGFKIFHTYTSHVAEGIGNSYDVLWKR